MAKNIALILTLIILIFIIVAALFSLISFVPLTYWKYILNNLANVIIHPSTLVFHPILLVLLGTILINILYLMLGVRFYKRVSKYINK